MLYLLPIARLLLYKIFDVLTKTADLLANKYEHLRTFACETYMGFMLQQARLLKYSEKELVSKLLNLLVLQSAILLW